MKNTYKYIIKAVAFCASFVLLFLLVQSILTPKFKNESTVRVDGIKRLVSNEQLDVLFCGSSQMFCSIDAKMLTEKYNIRSYDYGSSYQCLQTTAYYLEEALKNCKPKKVYIEVGNIHITSLDLTDRALTWNYSPMEPNINKFKSVYSVTGDIVKSAEHTCFPLLLYHSRWNEIHSEDISYYFSYFQDDTYANRGYLTKDKITSVVLEYLNPDNDIFTIQEENKNAIDNISKLCKDNGIEIYFFKVPAPFWKQSQSRAVKSFMKEKGLRFIDYSDYLSEFGLDGNNDFQDKVHLNKYGAKKFTSFFVEKMI